MLAGIFTTLLYLVSLFHPPAALLLRPQQVRISWTERPHEVAVMFTTWLPLPSPSVTFSSTTCTSHPQRLSPALRIFQKNLKYDIIFECLYTSIITDLKSECEYELQVGMETHLLSKVFTFRGVTPYYSYPFTDSDLNRPARMAIFGDMGIGKYSLATRSHLLDAIKDNRFDGIMHLGDIGYDLERHMGGTADKFFREVEDIAASTPYMVIAGNHEHRQNFTHLSNLFRMPRNAASRDTNFFYSFNLGRAHFVALNAEAYFYLPVECAQTQYNWLVEDLKTANLHRDEVPWLIVFTHKPIYCQIDWRRPMEESKQFKCNYDCDHECKVLRGEWEDLFYEQGVDLIFGAHMHDYEREVPIFRNLSVLGDSDTDHFHRNPRAQISILSGTAGSDHLHDALSATPQLWNAAYLDAYGFGILEVLNSTHIQWQEFDSERRLVVDHVTVEKTWSRYPCTLN